MQQIFDLIFKLAVNEVENAFKWCDFTVHHSLCMYDSCVYLGIQSEQITQQMASRAVFKLNCPVVR